MDSQGNEHGLYELLQVTFTLYKSVNAWSIIKYIFSMRKCVFVNTV